jgi:hypothetical protein
MDFLPPIVSDSFQVAVTEGSLNFENLALIPPYKRELVERFYNKLVEERRDLPEHKGTLFADLTDEQRKALPEGTKKEITRLNEELDVSIGLANALIRFTSIGLLVLGSQYSSAIPVIKAMSMAGGAYLALVAAKLVKEKGMGAYRNVAAHVGHHFGNDDQQKKAELHLAKLEATHPRWSELGREAWSDLNIAKGFHTKEMIELWRDHPDVVMGAIVAQLVPTIDSIAYFSTPILKASSVVAVAGAGAAVGIGLPGLIIGTLVASAVLTVLSGPISKIFDKSPITTLAAAALIAKSGIEMMVGETPPSEMFSMITDPTNLTIYAGGVAMFAREEIGNLFRAAIRIFTGKPREVAEKHHNVEEELLEVTPEEEIHDPHLGHGDSTGAGSGEKPSAASFKPCKKRCRSVPGSNRPIRPKTVGKKRKCRRKPGP